LPLGFSLRSMTFEAPGRAEDWVSADVNAVDPDFFETMGIHFRAGGSFTDAEGRGIKQIVVNETAAARLWSGESALGKILPSGEDRMEVVGVVVNGKYRSVGEDPRSMIYERLGARYGDAISMVVRVSRGSPRIDRALRQIVHDLDPDLPVNTNQPYRQMVGASLLPNRVAAGVASAFGALGLMLAAIGLYGVLSFAVAQRTREMGIRMALGADRASVRREVLGGGLRLTALGFIVGCPLALAAGWLLRAMIHPLSPADPLTFVVIGSLMVGVGILASWVPARRATEVDPQSALRVE